MNRRLIVLSLAVALSASVLTGCGTKTASEPAAETPAVEATVPEAPAVEMPTKENPMVVDAEAKTVRVFAEVNRKWVTEPTRHAVVCANGSNGDKAVFAAGGDAMEFNKALFEIGGKAGENVKKDSPAGTQVEGDALDITVSWDGEDHAINDLFTSTGELGGKMLAPKFGGNAEMQGMAKTGCLFCLDSCAAGITSNNAVGWKSFDTKKVEFRGNGDILPADGSPVVVTFALQ